MLRFITILIGCSLTFAVGVQAEQENPKKKPVQKSKPVQKQQVTPKQHTATNKHVQGVNTQHKVNTIPNNVKIHDSNVSKQKVNTLPAVQSGKVKTVGSNKLVPAVQKNKLPAVQADKVHAVGSNKLVPAVQPKNLPAVQSNVTAIQANKKVAAQNFQPQHVNFHAQPNKAIASVTYNQHYRINGSQNWTGNNYAVFRSYHPEWHDRGWWHSHHNRVVLIGGGWYFWNAGYWYPAWGYDTAAAYYPYDGPIYVGQSAAPLDQVIADVQSALQQQGYYHGEVDGLLGPLTREALANYQRDQGLYATETIDQPTLESLGLG